MFKVKVYAKGVKHKVWWLEFAQQRPQSGPLDDFGKCEEEHSLVFPTHGQSHYTKVIKLQISVILHIISYNLSLKSRAERLLLFTTTAFLYHVEKLRHNF